MALSAAPTTTSKRFGGAGNTPETLPRAGRFAWLMSPCCRNDLGIGPLKWPYRLPMYCITLRNKFDDTIVGWYDQSASHFSTDQRRAKVFGDREAADLVANKLRSQYPRVAQYIDVAAIEPTAIVYIFDRNRAVAL